MHLCMLVCLAFLLFSALLLSMFLGLIFPAVCGVRCVLFVGLRDGDVTSLIGKGFIENSLNFGGLWSQSCLVGTVCQQPDDIKR